jgi:predicted methyltransferase
MSKANGQLDLRRAINAVSDVIQNRPQPLREFDQIYMKAADKPYRAEVCRTQVALHGRRGQH